MRGSDALWEVKPRNGINDGTPLFKELKAVLPLGSYAK